MGARKKKETNGDGATTTRAKHVVSPKVKGGQLAERVERLLAQRDKKLENAPQAIREDFSKRIKRELSKAAPDVREFARRLLGDAIPQDEAAQ